jgi:hypothetical protein
MGGDRSRQFKATRGHGQAQREHAALSDLAREPDLTSVELDKSLRERQSKSSSMLLPSDVGVDLPELFEKVLEL